MNVKNLAIGAVVGGIVLFVLGLLLFDVLFLDYYTANAGAAAVGIRATQIYWATALGALISCLIDAQPGKAGIAGGLKMGALAGFLLWFTTDFTIYGYLDLWNLPVTILDIVLETARAAISGAVVALVIGKLG